MPHPSPNIKHPALIASQNVGKARLLDVVHVDDVRVRIELQLLALNGSLAGVLGVEDGIELLELRGYVSK